MKLAPLSGLTLSNAISPTLLILPSPKSKAPPVILIPDLAVITPTESTFVTSCLVSVPAIETLPEAVISPTIILSEEELKVTFPVLP